MKIGDLAKQFRVPVETIRFYEKQGLLPAPARSGGNYRIYGPAHTDRLRFVVNCRALDMTLDEIRALLGFHDAPREDCGDINALLDEHLGHIGDRIAELQRLDRQLRRLRRACAAPRRGAPCGILESLKRAPAKARAPVRRAHSR